MPGRRCVAKRCPSALGTGLGGIGNSLAGAGAQTAAGLVGRYLACPRRRQLFKPGGGFEQYRALLAVFGGPLGPGEAPSLPRIQAALDKLYAAPSPSADSRLQIMTIHKSKGLEFDAVFLPSLHKGKRPADKQLWLWQRHQPPG